MIREIAVFGIAATAVTAWSPEPVRRAPPRSPAYAFADGFDRGLCTGSCPGAHWAIRQEVAGTVDVVPAPGRSGRVLRARTGPKRGGIVAKAALVARPAPMRGGTRLRIAFDIYAPSPTPLDSLQIVDIECATCGEGGNPGIRLYLRRGRLRIDRSKIGIARAWMRDDAPTLSNDRWHHVELLIRIGVGEAAGARVTLDGRTVLDERGTTVLPVGKRHVDRVQIGITANSNAVPATLYFDNVQVSAAR